ncbi:MAG TPA: efflux RND transporter periplasmic adaptor subunit [Gemmatimonadaceae bacterium]|nr:efflux RND transporter periplasmic adaptor subunit [Gemmatimonadaceae bacterium]
MSRSIPVVSRANLRSLALIAALLATAVLLGAWKYTSVRSANAAAANQMEPMETVAAAVATARPHQESATAIGTVLAPRSITLRNEVPGTVRSVGLQPGRIVSAGAVLVALDVSVENAELRAQEAQARLAQTNLDRVERMTARGAASAMELDNTRAERDVALAQVARTRALIARKTIRAPFRARVGMADVHLGQFLEAGTQLSTLQGVDGAVHVDFAVSQSVAAGMHRGEPVRVISGATAAVIPAHIVAIDARVDPTTRNAVVRAELPDLALLPAPGSSVRVEVPVGPARDAVVVPVSALRKGPGGDHVFVIGAAKDGKTRAQLRLVKTGPVLGDEIVVTEGLAVGERVAASGSFKLRDAALVAVADTGAKTKRVSAR